MKGFTAFILRIVLHLLVSTSVYAAPELVCHRPKILQTLHAVKNSKQIDEVSRRPYLAGDFPASSRLVRIFKDLESKTFGRRILHIEAFPAWPGLTLNGNVIQFSTITDQTLQRSLNNPDLGAAFGIAHEMGHLIQNIQSPHGLSPVSSLKKPAESFIYHSETDCIAVEIMAMAGYPITAEIPQTLSLIKEECKLEQNESFCNEADRIRQSTVRRYLLERTR